MKIALLLIVVAVVVGVVAVKVRTVLGQDVVRQPTTAPAQAGSEQMPKSALDFTISDIDGQPKPLSAYRGKVVMLVNVASKCGATPQYAALEQLYKDKAAQGLVIIGIPANNFGGQEPGTEAQIKAFCTDTYDVTFPMMSKLSVKGNDIAPLYRFLTTAPTAGEFAGEIGWNFTKFLIDRNGNVVARFATKTPPSDPKVVAAIDAALAMPEPVK